MMIRLAVLALVLSLATPGAIADHQPKRFLPLACDHQDTIAAMLSERYSEAIATIGISKGSEGKNLIEVWRSADGDTFTIMLYMSQTQERCLLAAGENLLTVIWQLKGGDAL